LKKSRASLRGAKFAMALQCGGHGHEAESAKKRARPKDRVSSEIGRLKSRRVLIWKGH